jgi:CRP/FNR family transcriptional regulator, cyclic AMP receptor protein
MFDLGRLKSIGILSELNERMLKKVGGIAKILYVKAGQYIFNDGDIAERLYSVLEGKVVLEISQSSRFDFEIQDIVPTGSFGISSLVDSEVKQCVSHAKAVEDSKLLVWKASDLEILFQKDHKLGYLMIKKTSTVLRDRLQNANTLAAATVISPLTDNYEDSFRANEFYSKSQSGHLVIL